MAASAIRQPWRGPRAGRATAYAASIIAGLILWQIVASRVSSVVLASPFSVGKDLFLGLFVTGTLVFALLQSLLHMALGLLISFAVAVPLGFLIGRSLTAEKLLQPTIALLYSVPPVAFVPFMVVWFGLQFEARVALVVLMSFFEIVYVVAAGARAVPKGFLDVAQSFSGSRLSTIRKVLIPAASPALFTALRVGLVRGINAMITAELFFAAVNLGKLMKDDAESFDTSGMLAIVVLLCLFGLLTQELLKWLEERALPWHIRRSA